MDMYKNKGASRERVLALKVLLVLAALVLLIMYFVTCSRKGGDFVTFLEAATKMWQGKNIYAPPYVNLRYSYSPFWAMILIPFALLPTGVGAFMWLVISLILFIRTIWLLRHGFRIRISDHKLDQVLWLFILLYISRYLELNFHHVQMTIFLAWLMVEALYRCDEGREIIAGILIGMGTIVKVMPVVMIPYFIYRRRFVAASSAIATVVVCFFIPLVFIGRSLFWEMNQSWYSILRPDSPEFQSEVSWHLPQNLSLLLYRLLVNTGAPYAHPVLNLTYSQATVIIWIVIAFLILLTLYFLSTIPFVKVINRSHQLYELSYIMLLIPLIFPHQMKYAFYFVLPAISCLMVYLVAQYPMEKQTIRYRIIAALVLVSFILGTATTDLVIGMDLSTITQHYKTITIGTLLLIPALAISRGYFTSVE